ncbi:MAG: hypothetical protein K2H64_12565 [Desulfovibrio sp.]|nr:hypothetical protein [Desulfovibrio sp.]
MDETMTKAIDDLLKVAMFENWLRFYFIKPQEDDDETIKIELPEKTLTKIAALYPEYLPLARELNGKPLDFAASRDAILMYVLDYIDGKSLPRGLADKAFSSKEFQSRLGLFNAWVQIHEEALDRGFLDFGQWVGLFREWEKARESGEPGEKTPETGEGS